MQKKSIFLFLGLSILAWSISILSFGGFYEYDYADTEQKIKLNSDFSGTYTYTLRLADEANSFVIALPKSPETRDTHVYWHIDGIDYHRVLDTEDGDDTSWYYSFPLVAGSRRDISITVVSPYVPVDADIIATDTNNRHYRWTWHPQEVTAIDQVSIVSRSQWGADESLRWRDQSQVDKKIQEWHARGKTPREVILTTEDQAAAKKESLIGKTLRDLHPESFLVVSKTRYQDGHKLTWPVMTAKSVDRIVVHHTAETMEQSTRDDMAIMRAIYTYHTKTRGWGDIGYNYIVGKDGTIYEGRAGGDYVEGAHAYANNLGTVGVSLMGNFDTATVPDAQLAGLEDIVVYLARKYGIDVLEDTTGFRTCDSKKNPDCIIDTRSIKRLHGHRDVGYTSCPGKYLYAQLDSLRLRVATRVGKVIPVPNPRVGVIDPVPGEDMITYIYPSEEKPKQVALQEKNNILIRPTTSLGGKNIKIRLSYPNKDSIGLSSASIGRPILKIDNKNILSKSINNIDVGIVGHNQLSVRAGEKFYTGKYIEYTVPVVRIDSWSRIPSWDTAGKYNDNMFRKKIILHNQGGKLLVINELPLEDYLRGLGEVSNSDHSEKIKTITVAARSYARYYMERMNRKYSTDLYDGSDDPESFQRYLGYSYELRSPNVSREVANTLGQVITYNRQIIKAWYFSSSAGRTLSYKEYCEAKTGAPCADIAYLQSVVDSAGVGKSQSGHGVGISGVGATAMAGSSKTYKEIIQYYMNGVAIEKK